MRISLAITDGLRQVVLTPDGPDEKNILDLMHRQEWRMEIKRGQFFICQGGYARFGGSDPQRDESTMLVLRPAIEQLTEGQP